MLRDSTAKFMAREFVPKLDGWIAQGRVDRDDWRRAGDQGLLCVGIPEDYGGLGGTFAHEAAIIEELEYAGIGNGFGNTVHSAIVAPYILKHGTEEQRQRWLPRLATGDLVGAIAMTEPGTGSDLQSIRTTAVRDGDAYRLTGAKTFITNGQLADLIVVVAKTDPAARGRGISLLVLETDCAEGFRRGRNLKKIGLKASDTSELFFDDVMVPAENLLGDEEGRGFSQLMEELPQERVALALVGVAAAERAVALTSSYVKERTAFGRPLLDLQNTRFKLAEQKTETVIARVFIDHCIMRLVEGGLDTVTASMAKWWCTERQGKVVDECLQLHGGYGYMDEYPIARMYTDARVQRIYGGTTEIMKELIARSI